MKQRIKLKGRLKAYLQTAIILGIVLAGVNVGSEGHHGRNEFACIEDMEKIVEILKQLVAIYADFS